MIRWTAFTGIVGVVLTLLLALTRLSATAVRDSAETESVPEPSLTSVPRQEALATSRGTVTERIPTRPATGRETGSLDRLRAAYPEASDQLAGEADPDGRYEVRLRVRAATLRGGGRGAVSRSSGSDPVGRGVPGVGSGATGETDGAAGVTDAGTPNDPTSVGGVDPTTDTLDAVSTGAMLANVTVSQGVFAAVVVAAAWWAGIPASAVGVEPSGGIPAVALGLWFGVGLWLASESASRLARRVGVDPASGLRELLSPTSRGEWALLLGVALPTVAVFEELLFRGVLIGVLAAGFGLPAWALVVGSSVAFAAGHSAQGRLGVVVTGVLGVVLGAAFVATGSLLVVIVAHYVVNAAEFIVHES